MTLKTFKRYELKYFVDPEQYQIICKELSGHMVYDNFCKNGKSYTIYNLYYDTPDDAVIRHSLEKPYYKEKLRMRSYITFCHSQSNDLLPMLPTTPSLRLEQDTVFLELKKKIGGIVAKRRVAMSYSDAVSFIETGVMPYSDNGQDRQVLREIAEFLSRYPVLPKVYISYERTAFFDRQDSEFRVSFDRSILTRRNQVNLTDGNYGTELLSGDGCLMEIKCAGAIPLWLCDLLTAMKIYRTNFSKYGVEYKHFIAVCTRKEAA